MQIHASAKRKELRHYMNGFSSACMRLCLLASLGLHAELPMPSLSKCEIWNMKLEKEGQIAWNILEQLHCKRKGATGECPTRAPQRSPTSNLLPRFLKSGTYRTAASTLSGKSDHGNKGMILNPCATPSETTAREHLEKIADRKRTVARVG